MNYRMTVVIDFESSKEIPDITLNGSMNVVEQALWEIDSPEDIDDDKTQVNLMVRRRVD